VIGKRLFVLLACLFVVMIGFGITLPVLPFYVERLAQAEGVTPEAIVMHVTLLTAVYGQGHERYEGESQADDQGGRDQGRHTRRDHCRRAEGQEHDGKND
jgi:hypothetical protein